MNTVDILGDQQTADLIVSKAITEFSDDNLSSVGAYAFYECGDLVSVRAQNAAQVGYGAFYNCASLSDVYLPNVTVVNLNAFYVCRNIRSLDMPKLRVVYYKAFSGCGFEKLYLPSLESTDRDSFESCMYLKTADFPSLEKLNSECFSSCYRLESLTIGSVDSTRVCYYERYEGRDDLNNRSALKIYVAPSLVFKYKNSPSWKWASDKIFPIVSSLILQEKSGDAHVYGGDVSYSFAIVQGSEVGDKPSIASVSFSNDDYVSNIIRTSESISFDATNKNTSNALERLAISILLDNGEKYEESVAMMPNGFATSYSCVVEGVAGTRSFLHKDGVYYSTSNSLSYGIVRFKTNTGKIIFDVGFSSFTNTLHAVISNIDETILQEPNLTDENGVSLDNMGGSFSHEIQVDDENEHFITIRCDAYGLDNTFTFMPRFE